MNIEELKGKLEEKVNGIKYSLAQNDEFAKASEKLPFLAKLVEGVNSSPAASTDEATEQMAEEDKTDDMDIEGMGLDADASEDDSTEADINLDDDEEDSEKPPQSLLDQIKSDPEKRKKVIMGAAVLAVAWLLLDDGGNKAKQENTQQVAKAQKKDPMKKEMAPPIEEKKIVEQAIDVPKEKSEESPVPIEQKVKKEELSESLEQNNAEKLEPSQEEIVKKNDVQLDTETLGLDTDTNQVQQELAEEASVEEPTSAVAIGASSEVSSSLGQDNEVSDTSSNIDQSSDEDKTKNILTELENQFSKNAEAQKEPLVYTSPTYRIVGRGLVYSCKGRHWACINGENYGKCEKNFKFNSTLAKNIECFPSEVYATVEDCGRAQQLRIDGNEESKFCKK